MTRPYRRPRATLAYMDGQWRDAGCAEIVEALLKSLAVMRRDAARRAARAEVRRGTTEVAT